MLREPPSWVVPLMRVGFAARGLVYVAVGALALLASVYGGSTPDTRTALAGFLDEPLGEVLVAVIAAGLVCYAVWRFVDALWDLDRKGSDAKGIVARLGQFFSGLTHLTLGISTAVIASGQPEQGDRSEHWTAVLMAQPFGRWLVALVGVAVIVIALAQFRKGVQERYRQELRYTEMAAKLGPVMKLGLLAHGTVILIVGSFFIWAAWTADPSRAGGLRDALNLVRSTQSGQWLFATMAVGLLSFAAYCFVCVVYRIVPRCAGGLTTLQDKAREIQEGVRKVARDVADQVR